MSYDMVLLPREGTVSWDSVIDPPMKSRSGIFENKESFRQMSLKLQLVSFLSSFGISVEAHSEGGNDVCYKIKNGFFYDTLIFIFLREGISRIIFKVNNYKQGYTLQKLSSGIEKKMAARRINCKVEVIFENRRL